MAVAIRAVCFDLDNTLWDSGAVISRAEAQLRDWLNRHYPLIPQAYSVSEMRAERLRIIQAEPDGAHDLSHVRHKSLARHAAAVGYGRDVADQALEVFLIARNQLELFADVESALVRLDNATLSPVLPTVTPICCESAFRTGLQCRSRRLMWVPPNRMRVHSSAQCRRCVSMRPR